MTEHPFNVRPARSSDRTHNSRRHLPETRWVETVAPARSYRGNHRADDSRPADDRRSRAGRHYATARDEQTDRW